MIYLFVQTFGWLLLAVLLGFVIAWLLRGIRFNSQMALVSGELRNTRSQMKRRLVDEQKANVTAERLIADLEAKKLQCRQQIQEFAKLRAQNAAYEQEIVHLREELTKTVANYNDSRASEDELKKNLDTVEGKIAEVVQVADQSGTESKRLEVELESMTQKQVALAAERDRVVAANDELRTKSARFESELDAVAETQAALEQEQGRLEAEIERLHTTMTDQAESAQTERRRLTETLDQERAAHENALAALREQFDPRSDETGNLREQLAEMTARYEACERQREISLAESGLTESSSVSDDWKPVGLPMDRP